MVSKTYILLFLQTKTYMTPMLK